MEELNIFWHEVADEIAALGVHRRDEALDPETIKVLAGLLGFTETMAMENTPQNFAEVFLYRLM